LAVTIPDGRIIEYIHDPLGRRIAKKVDGIIIEKYLWQGLARLLAVYDGSDNLLMRFEYAGGRMPVAMTKGGSTFYLTYDQVGSLRVVADTSGNVVKRIDYDSFGNIIDDTDPAFEVPFAFAGGLNDQDTGLVRFGYRDYDPDTGRWTAKDPILFAGGDTDLYGYCLNDPINWIDPWGLSSSSCPPNKEECIKNCLDKNYGDLYTIAKSLSPLGAVSMVLNVASSESARALKRSATIKKHTIYKVGARQMKTYSQFSRFNTAMAVVGAFASGFQAGAYGYCYYQCAK
jgi:RHS repeat-associated protein